MKILSFHPFSLYSNGGGSRILRRLYAGKEANVISLVSREAAGIIQNGDIEEIFVDAAPLTRKWMRWYLRDAIIRLRQKTFKFLTIKRIRKKAVEISCDVIHTVQHGPFCGALCAESILKDKSLWVSFHDHFSTTQTEKQDAEKLWKLADRRLVISEEFGKEYQRLFGSAPYEIITDGVSENEVTEPLRNAQTPVIIYFAGLLHIDYMPLFKILADALDILSKGNKTTFKLILRGTQNIGFLNNRSFETEYRPTTLNDALLKSELNSAAILYLPIKFTRPDFYLYSLSTKMVGYLGGAGTILYHGPEDSAACRLLKRSDAAICCTSVNMDDMVQSIENLIADKGNLSANAKTLAQKKFNLAMLQNQFWQA